MKWSFYLYLLLYISIFPDYTRVETGNQKLCLSFNIFAEIELLVKTRQEATVLLVHLSLHLSCYYFYRIVLFALFLFFSYHISQFRLRRTQVQSSQVCYIYVKIKLDLYLHLLLFFNGAKHSCFTALICNGFPYFPTTPQFPIWRTVVKQASIPSLNLIGRNAQIDL